MKRIWNQYVETPWGGIDWERSDWEWAEDGAPCDLCDRGGQAMAKSAFKSAQTTASGLGASAASERAPLERFDIANLINPQGFGQQGTKEMLTAALGGAGGSSASEIGEEELAAKRGTTGPNSAVMDEIARQRAKAGATASEGIAAQDVTAKLGQQQEAASDLSRRYGIDVGAQLGAMGQESGDVNAEVNASSHGWLQALESFAQSGATAAAGLCPAEGSRYRMADGSDALVESLKVGDLIRGIDGEDQIIERIESELAPCIEVKFENGFTIRNSYTHAFALPYGGFTVASRSMGKTVPTEHGISKVVSITPVGVLRVFNVMTDGSHTYMANGIWSVGVGDAERHVSMEEWREIGEKLMSEVA